MKSSRDTTIAHYSKSIAKTVYPYVKPFFTPPKHTQPVDAYIEHDDTLLGSADIIFSGDGKGLNNLVVQLGNKAKDRKDGVAKDTVGPLTFNLLTRPDHIKKMIHDNQANLVFHDSTGSFKLFFGPNTIFNLKLNTPEWQHARHNFLMRMGSPNALKSKMKTMQNIINKHFAAIDSNEGEITNLEVLANSVTMDMIGGTELGLANISEQAKKEVSRLIGEAIVQIANPFDQVMADRVPLYGRIANKKFFYENVTGNTLYKILEDGHQLILDELVKPNIESILKEDNWIRSLLAEKHKPTFWNCYQSRPKYNFQSKEVAQEITEKLVVGQETSAKLFMMLTLLLADPKHAEVIEKIRAEVDSYGGSPETWGEERPMPPLPYLDAVISEALRLYPPIPDMVFKAENGFKIDDIEIEKGSFTVISQRITHLMKQRWDEKSQDWIPVWGNDAHEFDPSRMMNLTDEQKKNLDYQFFPFGENPKKCLGQKYVRQELKLWLARLLDRYDLVSEYKHPFPFHQIFTMRVGMDNVGLRLKRRELSNENQLRVG